MTRPAGNGLHWVEFSPSAPKEADTAAGSPIVLVHGLGGSHLDWVLIADRLGAGRVFAVDLPGFGLTPAGAGRGTVEDNVRLLQVFIDEVVGEPAILVGNSMGGAVSALVAAGSPAHVAGLVLIDPSLPLRGRPDPRVVAGFLVYAVPGLGELAVKLVMACLSDEVLLRQTLMLCFADPQAVDERLFEANVALRAHQRTLPGASASFLRSARSVLAMILLRPAPYRAALSRIEVPRLLIHGVADRLIPVAAAEALLAEMPGWTSAILPGVGHIPQLEAPDQVVEVITEWLERSMSRRPTPGP